MTNGIFIRQNSNLGYAQFNCVIQDRFGQPRNLHFHFLTSATDQGVNPSV